LAASTQYSEVISVDVAEPRNPIEGVSYVSADITDLQALTVALGTLQRPILMLAN
jgi:hypothetical protein